MTNSKAAEDIVNILSLFYDEPEELGISEISRKLNLYPSKIHRLFVPLVHSGLLEQNPVSRKYRLGVKCFELGMLYINQNALRKMTRPHMEALANKLTINVSLAILRNTSAILIDILQLWRKGDMLHLVTFNVPLHSAAVGKVLLAYLPDDKQREALKSLPLRKFTDRTITQPTALEKELRKVRREGYAVDLGESFDILHSIAAPIRDKNAVVIAAMSLDDEKSRMTRKEINRLLPELINTTDFISKQLGFESLK